ncbi:MAG: DUF3971 domain-containing protein [Saprospiraceae bacterium]|nr:DUF3971 domain-containing protein [Saprospiraceae bacterium]
MKNIPKNKKLLKRVIISLSIILFVFIGVGLAISYLYEDKVKEIIKAEINKQIDTEIEVEEIEFSVIKKFPFASLRFKNVVIKDAIKKGVKGNFLEASDVYLKFSIFNLFRSNYKITKVEVVDAYLKIIVYDDESDNYHIFKAKSDESSESFAFNLEKVYFKNVKTLYSNFASDQEYLFIAESAYAKGQFSSENYVLAINGDFFINYIKSEDYVIIKEKEAQIDLQMDVEASKDLYKINKGKLKLSQLSFEINGEIINLEESTFLNLEIKGQDFDLQSLIRELPETEQEYLKKYKSRGDFFFAMTINGDFGGSKKPLVIANFGLNKGEISNSNSSITLKELSFQAEYSNGTNRKYSSSYFKVNNLKGKLKTGSISGDLMLNNFNQPELEISSSAKLELSELLEFINIDTITSLTGHLELNANFKSILNLDENFTAKDFINSKTSGKIVLKNAGFTIKNDPLTYKELNGSFEFNNNDIIVKEMTGKILKSDFELKGYFRNVLPYLFLSNERLQLNAELKSGFLDLNEILAVDDTKSDTTYNFQFSHRLDAKISFNVDKLSFRKFEANDLNGSFRLKNKQMIINKLSFKSMDGKIETKGLIDGTQENKLLFSCDGIISNVDIEKLFYQFEDFGQSDLTHANLSGRLDADVQFVGVWSSSLMPDLNSIYSNANITVKNGELKDYKTLEGLSKFIKVEDLSHIKFATLKNQIEIKNQIIKMPMMEINSSAINIVVSGTHSFNNDIDYHLQLLLSDLLAKKAKKQNSDFGEIEDDGLGRTKVFILVTGTVDNPIYKYDRKGVKEN